MRVAPPTIQVRCDESEASALEGEGRVCARVTPDGPEYEESPLAMSGLPSSFDAIYGASADTILKTVPVVPVGPRTFDAIT